MVSNKIQIPQQQISVPEAVNALLAFMQDQMRINVGVRQNMQVIEQVVVRPMFRDRNASGVTCVSAIV